MAITFLYWKLHALYSRFCQARLYYKLSGIKEIIAEYSNETQSTGTKFPTLFHAVAQIQRYKPRYILEAGTGTSTIVLAETVLQLQAKDPSYRCEIISMESISKWHEMASKLLPQRYSKIVDIRLGEREQFQYSMFRGYCHSNIPKLDYDFVFVDGPSYGDEFGSSSCLDALKVRLISNATLIRGVIDTRVSTVMVLQSIFGVKAVQYFSLKRTCTFTLHKVHPQPKLRSWNFRNSLWGQVAPNSGAFLPEYPDRE